MVEPECSDGNLDISAIPREEIGSPPVQLPLSDLITGTEQSSIHMCGNENALNLSDITLKKEHEVCNETDMTAKRLHGNDHEHNEMNLNAEVKPVEEEIPIGSVPMTEITDKDADSHIVTQFKHTDITTAEDTVHTDSHSCESVCTSSDPQTIYSVQQYKFENCSEITCAWKEFQKKEDMCMRGCKWSPDGTCILTNSDDNMLRIFDLPPDLHCQESWQRGRMIPELQPALCVTEGGLVYDYCWYPLMSSWNPLSCCLVSTSKDSPIHLWDAFTGELRCTYRAYNAVDEVEAAHSLAFSPCGEKLYCGFKNVIRIFNTNLPGRHCETRNLKQASFTTQRQTGILSCICVNPAMPDIYAVGSYTKSLGVYSEPNGTLLCLLLGHSGGITHLQFSSDGTKLLSGGRKDSEIICWDMRNPGTVLFSVQRNVTTNQRMYFDITPDSRHLVSGNTNGDVSVWDMLQSSTLTTAEPVLAPYITFHAHSDCVNGLSIHQQYPILATASGQRHMTFPDSESDAMESSYLETSLKLWWVGNIASES